MKYAIKVDYNPINKSPSMRREWIEILLESLKEGYTMSPSMRREWIEIMFKWENLPESMSPSMRREWIEINVLELS